MRFTGRETEIGRLTGLLERVRTGAGPDRGQAISIRGRRRVGKSRMVREFLDRAAVPYVYFNAEHATPAHELARFAAEVAASSLPGADLYVPGENWSAALRGLALSLPADSPAVVVIDEVPCLTRDDQGFEGALQGAWDRVLSRLPVLLVLVGSNRAEMERLTSYDRPFYLRGTEMEVGPLTVADVASLTGLAPAEAIDAFLVTGGLPMILGEWKHGTSVRDFLATAVADPLSALHVSGERSLSAELPVEANARAVLGAIGTGERTFTAIAQRAGLAATALERALAILVERRLVVVEQPLATVTTRNNRYRIEDPYLRFWLAFLADQLPNVEAGRPDLALRALDARWTAWRGRAVEPILRDLLRRRPGLVPEATAVIGGFWNRSNSIAVDLVGADRPTPAQSVTFLGSVAWHEQAPFDAADLAHLVQARTQVPGATASTPLVAVSRTGFSASATGLTTITPDHLVATGSVYLGDL